MYFFRILILFFLLSCEDNFKEIQNINSKSILPIGITENLKLIYTDSAKVKAVLYSSLNKDFTNQSFPYSEFPVGVKIIFYDDDLNETIVTSDYAITYNKTNIVNLTGNVIINNYDGSELKTKQLYWDPEQEWLFTEERFSFKNIDYDIIANRLDANRSFSIFNTGKLDGTVMLEDNIE